MLSTTSVIRNTTMRITKHCNNYNATLHYVYQSVDTYNLYLYNIRKYSVASGNIHSIATACVCIALNWTEAIAIACSYAYMIIRTYN